MSVLACDRVGCSNIMCDRLIMNGRYYICNSCFAELLEVKLTWPSKMAKNDVAEHIRSFMTTEPNTFIELEDEEIDQEFDCLVNS